MFDLSQAIATEMRTCHVMTDIETMDVKPSSAILSIGAVVFDPFGNDDESTIDKEKRCFHRVISLESNEKAGRSISASTILWWLGQSKEAQNGLLDNDHHYTLTQALTQFALWLTNFSPKITRFWAKSPDFDYSIIAHAMNEQKILVPWKFFETRCVRTIIETAYPDGDAPQIGVGVAHDAMDDAIRQALQVQDSYRILHKAGNTDA